jgi:histidine ammonia-lyase
VEATVGLSLINGTLFMSGVATLMCSDVDCLLPLAIRTGAWNLEIVGGFDNAQGSKWSETYRGV